VGPRASLDDVERRKIFPLPRLELLTTGREAVANLFTDCAIPAH
jgi:hypothetical protein